MFSIISFGLPANISLTCFHVSLVKESKQKAQVSGVTAKCH